MVLQTIRAMNLQTLLVIHMCSSLVPLSRPLTESCLERPRQIHSDGRHAPLPSTPSKAVSDDAARAELIASAAGLRVYVNICQHEQLPAPLLPNGAVAPSHTPPQFLRCVLFFFLLVFLFSCWFCCLVLLFGGVFLSNAYISLNEGPVDE
jgi:hypothetical protein